MKIGANGLQAMIVQEAMPPKNQAENQAKMNSQAMSMEMGLAGAAVKRRELVKALERMNRSSRMYTLDYEFVLVEKDGEVYVAMVDKNTGEVKRKLLPERFLDGLVGGGGFSGVMVDSKG